MPVAHSIAFRYEEALGADGMATAGGAKRNLVTRNIGPLLLLRQGKEDPTDAEWAETMPSSARS
jgi:hypothetical protein